MDTTPAYDGLTSVISTAPGTAVVDSDSRAKFVNNRSTLLPTFRFRLPIIIALILHAKIASWCCSADLERLIVIKTPADRLRRLLDYGYFAPELPPCFSSRGFGAKGVGLLTQMKKLPKVSGRPAYQRFISDKSTFYHPRFNNTDRLHSVVNPISHLLTSAVIAKRYKDLRMREMISNYSISRSIFDWNGSRAIRRPAFTKRDEFISQVSPRFEYTVTSDIRAFYHSIYTGSIPWAVHGGGAKGNHSLALYGNEISMLVRNAQGGQTTGIPVGPDTSRILAEVIASSIDHQTDTALGMKDGDASRFVDDFTFGCNSIEEGQRIIAEIRRASAEFELDIGKDKTAIEPTNHLAYVGWQDYLRSYLPEESNKASFERYFYIVHDMSKRHPKLNIEKFAMQICRKAFVDSDEWSFLQDHIISSYRKNSTLIDTMVDALVLRQEEKGDVDMSSLSDFISARLPILGTNQRSGEALWLLYLCCRLGVEIKADTLTPCLRQSNPMIAILVTWADTSGLIQGTIDRSYWSSFATTEGLHSSMFLFAYEAARNGWETNIQYCEDHQFYGLLFSEEISFFDLMSGQKDLRRILRDRSRENKLSKYFAQHDDFTSDPDVDFKDIDADEQYPRGDDVEIY